MKKVLLAVLLLAASQARAGIYYQLMNNASSDTLRVGYAGVDRSDSVLLSSGTATFVSTSATAGYTVMQALNSVGAQILKLTQSGALTVSSFIGNLTGNVVGNLTGNVTGNVTGVASQATIWDHSPTGCAGGNYPTGSDTGGNFTGCTAAGAGTVTTTAGAAAGSTARFTGSTAISSGAFTDNGTTVTAPSGSNMVFGSGSTLNVAQGGGCIGTACRTFFSSGTANSFSFVIPSSTTWRVEYGISVTSGATGAAQSVFNCTVNGDATAGHYIWDEYMQGTAAAQSGHGTGAFLTLGTGGGGTFQTNDVLAGELVFRQIPGTNRLDYHGNGNDTEGGLAGFEAYGLGGFYVSTTVGLTSWTVTCAPQAGTAGIIYEVIGYQVGK